MTQATQLVDGGLPREYCKPKTAEHGGYYDPEYSRTGVMDKSTDIYCFGVVRAGRRVTFLSSNLNGGKGISADATTVP